MMKHALVAAALLFAASSAHAEPAKKKLDLRSAELYLRTLEGASTKLGPYAGKKLTLLNLWATWCGPCREEMPALDRLYAKWKAQGVQVVGLDIDESPDTVKRFLSKQKIGYPMLASTEHKTVAALGELEALPTTLILDEMGDVLEVIVGGLEMPDLEKMVGERLGAKVAKKK